MTLISILNNYDAFMRSYHYFIDNIGISNKVNANFPRDEFYKNEYEKFYNCSIVLNNFGSWQFLKFHTENDYMLFILNWK